MRILLPTILVSVCIATAAWLIFHDGRPSKLTFPADENGDVLRRMQAAGDDFTKARDIDFNHIFPKEEDAKRFSGAVHELGYQNIYLSFFEEKNAWDVRVVVFMLPTHSGITEAEQKLDGLARRYFGHADGWGCLVVK
jgi:hypothetical protein